jgi:uncharacterized protein DUF1360
MLFYFIPQGDYVILLHLTILALATWRISSLLVNEDGPYQMLAEFRSRVIKYTRLLECVWCVSLWIAGFMTIAYYFVPLYAIWIMLPFALSAGAILIDRIVNG